MSDEAASYYGQPIINPPVWSARDIAGYLFLGGLAGASSTLGAAAQATRRPGLARAAKIGAASSASLSLVALVHDLGRPARFLKMLRVFKPTSPMSVGSWLLAGYVPAAMTASVSDLTGRARVLGGVATVTSAVAGPALAAYTAVLISDTAVPSWHEGRDQMPFVFVSSGGLAAAGVGLIGAPRRESGPARTLAAVAAVSTLVSTRRMEAALGDLAEPYHQGRAGTLLRTAKVLATAGAVTAVAARGRRAAGAAAGVALLTASACERFGIFLGGMASARDPAYTVGPQRRRLEARARQTSLAVADGA